MLAHGTNLTSSQARGYFMSLVGASDVISARRPDTYRGIALNGYETLNIERVPSDPREIERYPNSEDVISSSKYLGIRSIPNGFGLMTKTGITITLRCSDRALRATVYRKVRVPVHRYRSVRVQALNSCVQVQMSLMELPLAEISKNGSDLLFGSLDSPFAPVYCNKVSRSSSITQGSSGLKQ